MVRVRDAYRNMKRLQVRKGYCTKCQEAQVHRWRAVYRCVSYATFNDLRWQRTLWGPWCKRSYIVGWTTANGLLAETTDIQIKRLQTVPNTATGLVSGQQHHSNPIIRRSLHPWFPQSLRGNVFMTLRRYCLHYTRTVLPVKNVRGVTGCGLHQLSVSTCQENWHHSASEVLHSMDIQCGTEQSVRAPRATVVLLLNTFGRPLKAHISENDEPYPAPLLAIPFRDSAWRRQLTPGGCK